MGHTDFCFKLVKPYNPGDGDTGSSQMFHCNLILISSFLKVVIFAWDEYIEVIGCKYYKLVCINFSCCVLVLCMLLG